MTNKLGEIQVDPRELEILADISAELKVEAVLNGPNTSYPELIKATILGRVDIFCLKFEIRDWESFFRDTHVSDLKIDLDRLGLQLGAIFESLATTEEKLSFIQHLVQYFGLRTQSRQSIDLIFSKLKIGDLDFIDFLAAILQASAEIEESTIVFFDIYIPECLSIALERNRMAGMRTEVLRDTTELLSAEEPLPDNPNGN